MFECHVIPEPLTRVNILSHKCLVKNQDTVKYLPGSELFNVRVMVNVMVHFSLLIQWKSTGRYLSSKYSTQKHMKILYCWDLCCHISSVRI